MERFYSLIKISFEQGDLDSLVEVDLAETIKNAKPEWDDEFTREFADEWEERLSFCKGLVDYIKG